MGTNYYWNKPELKYVDNMDPKYHIGKRSSAGSYCWDCGLTLCIDGIDCVHEGKSGWYNVCPKCGGFPDQNNHNAAYMELGFSKASTKKLLGVSSCSSFSWAQNPIDVMKICTDFPGDPDVINEYGDVMTNSEFIDMIIFNCPIIFKTNIGQWFS